MVAASVVGKLVIADQDLAANYKHMKKVARLLLARCYKELLSQRGNPADKRCLNQLAILTKHLGLLLSLKKDESSLIETKAKHLHLFTKHEYARYIQQL